jgi:signal transduction histidine kinase
MERLVKDLLRLARLDAGQEMLDIVACDTRTLAEAVVADCRADRRGTRGSASRSPSPRR